MQRRCENLKPRTSDATYKNMQAYSNKISHFIMTFLKSLELLMSNSTKQIHISLICVNKMLTRCNRFFIADLIACSTCFGHHYAHHQELKSIIQWLLPVVFCAVVFSSSILQTGRITLSSTPDQLLEKPQYEIPYAATTV